MIKSLLKTPSAFSGQGERTRFLPPAHQKVPTHDPYNMGCNGQTARLPVPQTPQSAPRQSPAADDNYAPIILEDKPCSTPI